MIFMYFEQNPSELRENATLAQRVDINLEDLQLQQGN